MKSGKALPRNLKEFKKDNEFSRLCSLAAAGLFIASALYRGDE
jgi:hypothetical protein